MIANKCGYHTVSVPVWYAPLGATCRGHSVEIPGSTGFGFKRLCIAAMYLEPCAVAEDTSE